jgi:hypothetical protein
MKKNMGLIDRGARVLIALVLIYLYYTGVLTGTWGIVALVASIVFLLTSLVSFCPLYTILGINSGSKEK